MILCFLDTTFFIQVKAASGGGYDSLFQRGGGVGGGPGDESDPRRRYEQYRSQYSALEMRHEILSNEVAGSEQLMARLSAKERRVDEVRQSAGSWPCFARTELSAVVTLHLSSTESVC